MKKPLMATCLAIASGVAVLGAAMVGGERMLDVIPFASSSEHVQLAGEVESNRIAILKNTRDDFERAEQLIWDKILALDLAEVAMEGILPLHLMDQRERLRKERREIKDDLMYIKDELRRLDAESHISPPVVLMERQGRVIREAPQ